LYLLWFGRTKTTRWEPHSHSLKREKTSPPIKPGNPTKSKNAKQPKKKGEKKRQGHKAKATHLKRAAAREEKTALFHSGLYIPQKIALGDPCGD